LGKAAGGEIAREGVDAQHAEPRGIIGGFPDVNSAEVAAISESEDPFVQFEGNIHVNTVFSLVGKFQKFSAVGKP
jgi:hypothetical protein